MFHCDDQKIEKKTFFSDKRKTGSRRKETENADDFVAFNARGKPNFF